MFGLPIGLKFGERPLIRKVVLRPSGQAELILKRVMRLITCIKS